MLLEMLSQALLDSLRSLINRPWVARAILAIKNQFPEIIAVVGGDHASAKPDDFLKARADFIVKGEGEKGIEDVFNGIAKSGIIESSLITNDELNLTFPLRIKGWGIKKPKTCLVHAFEKEGVVYCMITSRGCGRNCDFCNSGEMWKRKVRLRSIESVEKELIGINLLGDACGIGFVDLDFFVSLSHTERIVDSIIKLKNSIKLTITLNSHASALFLLWKNPRKFLQRCLRRVLWKYLSELKLWKKNKDYC